MPYIFQKLDLPQDSKKLVSWLSSQEWPFHGNSKLSPQSVTQLIEKNTFDGSNHQTFWIKDQSSKPVGLIRLYDLDDIGDGFPLFDIRISLESRGKGIATIAVTWLTKYLFDTWPELTRIEGNTRSDNLAMQKVFQKCLYVKEGHHRKAWKTPTGEYLDAFHFAILREDWKAQKITPINW